MRPRPSSNNAMYATATHPKLASEIRLRRSLRVKFSNLKNVSRGELGASIFLAFSGGGRLPSLCVHVPAIIRVSAQEQMVRVDTAAVVAMMADQQSIWYGAKVKFVAVAMGGDIPMTDAYPSVTLVGDSSRPLPTVGKRACIGATPETFFGGLYDAAFVHVSIVAVNVPSLFTRILGYWKNSAAAARTEFLGGVRGIMGLHKKLPFLCQAGGDSQSLPGVFVALLPVHYSTFGDMMP